MAEAWQLSQYAALEKPARAAVDALLRACDEHGVVRVSGEGEVLAHCFWSWPWASVLALAAPRTEARAASSGSPGHDR